MKIFFSGYTHAGRQREMLSIYSVLKDQDSCSVIVKQIHVSYICCWNLLCRDRFILLQNKTSTWTKSLFDHSYITKNPSYFNLTKNQVSVLELIFPVQYNNRNSEIIQWWFLLSLKSGAAWEWEREEGDVLSFSLWRKGHHCTRTGLSSCTVHWVWNVFKADLFLFLFLFSRTLSLGSYSHQVRGNRQKTVTTPPPSMRAREVQILFLGYKATLS